MPGRKEGGTMSVARHLEEAAGRLKAASMQITLAREGPSTCDNQKVWLEALTEYCQALTDIQAYNNESIHEKLHELAGRTGLKKFPS
jgi:hypothetical protein